MKHRILPTNEERWALYEQASQDHKGIVASAQANLTGHLNEFPSLAGTKALPMKYDYPVSRHPDCPPMRWSIDFEFPSPATAYDVWKFYNRLQEEMQAFAPGPIKEEWVDGGYLIYFDAKPRRSEK